MNSGDSQPTSASGRVRIRVRGTGTFIKEGDEVKDFEFCGQQPGTPVKKDVRRAGQSQLYETTGEKVGSIVAHLKVPRDSTDPVADLYADLARLTKPMQKTQPKLPAQRALLDTPQLKVYWNKREAKLTALLTIDTASRPSAQMFQLMSELNKVIVNKVK